MKIYQRFLPYGVSIGSTVIALWLTVWLELLLIQSVSVLFFVAITVSTWYGGLRAGFVAIVLSTLAINQFFVSPQGQFISMTTSDGIRFATFCLVALVIHLLSDNLKNSKRKIEQLSQQLLDESAQRLRTALNAAQMGLWDWNLVTGEINWSPEHEQLFGLTVGTFDGSHKTFESCLHPDDRLIVNQSVQQALQTHNSYQHEFRVVWADGSIHWIEGRGQAFYDETGRPVSMTGTVMAIDERKQAQELLQQQFEQQRLVMEMTQRIRRSLNLQDILQTTVDEVRQYLQCDRVIIFQFSPGWSGTVAVESVGADWTAILSTELYDPCFGDKYVEPFKQGLVTAKSNIHTAGIKPCHLELLSNFQVKANLVVPILERNELWGLLIAHHCEAPRQWQSSEIDLLQQLAAQVSIAIQQSALFEQIQAELTERKQIEAALRQSEQRYRSLVHASAQIVWTTDADGMATTAPMGWDWEEMTGQPEAEHLGRGWLDVVHPDDRDRSLQHWLEACTHGSFYETEYRLRMKDGSYRDFAVRGVPILDADGKISEWIGTCSDITERKQAEIALRNSEQQLRLALEAAHAGAWAWELKTGKQYWSEELYRVFGLEPGSVDPSYENADQRLHPEDREWVGVEVAKAVEQGTNTNLEHRIVLPDGTVRWIHGISQMFLDELGQPETLAGLIVDITERKLAEIALRESEAKFRLLAETIEEVFLIQSADYSQTFYISPAYERIWGRSCESLYQNPAAWIESIYPEDRESLFAEMQRVRSGEICRTEYRIIKPNGELRWIAVQAFPVFDEAGQIYRLIASAQDISDRKQAQAALQESQIQLQQQLAEIETIYQSAPIGLNVLDTNLRFVRINQRLAEMNGVPAAEHLDRTIRELLPDLADAAEPLLRSILETGEPLLNVEISGATPAQPGVQRTWLESFLPLKNGDQIIGISTVCEEITDRKRMETERQQAAEALKQAKEELETRVAERTAQLKEVNDRLFAALVYQQQVKVSLRQSEEKFRQLAENIQDVFWMTDIQSQQVLYVSPAYERIWHRSSDSLYQNASTWFDAIHPDHRQQVKTELVNQVRTGQYQIEYRITRPDGSIRWIRDRSFPIKNESGELVRVAGIAEDITDDKQAEQFLQQQARQEQLLLNITQAIRQSLDLNAILDTAVTEVMQTLHADRVAVYRFNPDWSGDFLAESVSTDWVSLVGTDIQKVWEDTYLQQTQGGRFRNQETFVVPDIYTAGLQSCHIELLEQFQARAYAVAPIFSGENLWGLLAIYQNATARHWQSWEVELLQQIASQLSIAIQQSELYGQLQIELHERKQAEAVLQEADRRWRSLLDNVQLIVVGLDQTGNVNYVNSFFLSLTKYSEQEVLGKSWFDNFLPFSCQLQIQTVFAEVLAHNFHPYYQNFILTKSGEERLIAWNNTLLQDLDGNIVGTISIGEDITERHKIEQMKNEFIGIVSHELRTPLTAIQMSLGLLKTGIYDKKPDKFQRMLEIALIDTNRLVNLVNDILDLERLESGRAVLEKTCCQAAALMKQAVDGVQPLATAQQITLTIHPTDAEVWVAADAIIQTLTNLLSNAIKFSPADSTITLSAERQADCVLFQVSDQGRGIPADKLETIFGRFQQVDASDARQKGGTGLGLAICRSIIEQHGGKIWAQSTLGEGSTFFFTLPLEEIG